jgi:hypothetical protein
MNQIMILDSSVERARVGYWRRVWVGETTTQGAFQSDVVQQKNQIRP